MKQFLTDSVYYRKKSGFIFTNNILAWKIKKNKDEYSIVSNYLDKNIQRKIENEEIIAIVSPSNYRMLYDLKHLKTTKIYTPEFYESGRTFKLDNVKIVGEFNNYLKRSYLSYLNYSSLKNIGLNRIEQFVILLRIYLSSKMFLHDGLTLSSENTVIKSQKLKDKTVKITRLRFLNTVDLIQKELNVSFNEATKKILQMYVDLAISDPFYEDGFVIIKDLPKYSDVINLLKKILNKTIKYEIFSLTTVDTSTNIKSKHRVRRLLEDSSSFMDHYLSFQKEDYFEGKFLHKTDEISYGSIIKILKGLFPLKDTILTIKSLIKLSKINDDGRLLINKDIEKKIQLSENIDWIKDVTWEDIYKRDIADYNYILTQIKTKEDLFKCPICGSEYYNITPLRFFCRAQGCNFAFDRTTLCNVGIKTIEQAKMKEALENKKIFIRNNEGKNYLVYLRRNKDYFFLSLKEN